MGCGGAGWRWEVIFVWWFLACCMAGCGLMGRIQWFSSCGWSWWTRLGGWRNRGDCPCRQGSTARQRQHHNRGRTIACWGSSWLNDRSIWGYIGQASCIRAQCHTIYPGWLWRTQPSDIHQCWMLWVGHRAMGGGSCLYMGALVGQTWLQLHGGGELHLPRCTMSIISEMDNGACLQRLDLGAWGCVGSRLSN